MKTRRSRVAASLFFGDYLTEAMRTSSERLSTDAKIMFLFSWKSKIEKAVEKAANANRKQWEAKTSDAAANIATAIDALRDAQNTQTTQEDSNQKISVALSCITIFLVFLTVIFTGLSWCAFRDQLHVLQSSDATFKNTLIAANRAWLNPSHFEFVKTPDAPEGPIIMGYYENVGRFPALDIKFSAGWFPIPLAKPIEAKNVFPETPLWPGFDKTIRTGCRGNQPMVGGATQFPSTHVEGHFNVTAPDPIPDMRPVKDGGQIILLTGCLTYNTFDEAHHTGYCRYVFKNMSGQWDVAVCPVGNFAE